MSLDTQTIEEAAIELGVDPSFVEKDWYAVQVLEAIAAFSHSLIKPIFSGGTSLSKGYGLLQRFSEDLDFRALYLGGTTPNKAARRAFRNDTFKAVKAVDGIGLDEKAMDAGSNYFKVPLSYPNQFDLPTSLRPDLQLEFSYTQPQRESETKPIAPIIAQLGGEEPACEIACLSCIETAADKFSALVWRVIKRGREDKSDDPSMVRHLHDLYALGSIVEVQVVDFRASVGSAFEMDMQSGPRKLDAGLAESAATALAALKNDDLYQEEYDRFVAAE